MDDLLTRGVANIIPNKKELEKALNSGKRLNIYIGIDPTATKIHLGHAVPLRKLQAFAKAGHHVTFLIGDFTALIGDTSDKDTERPVLTVEEIEKNFQTYKEQASKILDFSYVKVRRNSEWLATLTFPEIVKLCQHFSFGDFASRELVKKRLEEGKKVGLHEALYPVMQGYDSYFMDTDLQIGGADQTFNMQAGRVLQEDLRGKESFVLATEYLTGTDGRKMSKSWGNAIWLDDPAEDMYRKVMAVNDNLIIEYFRLATEAPNKKIKEIEERLAKGENPRDIKKELAFEIVSELYNKEDARFAEKEFESTVQHKEVPTEIPEYVVVNQKINLADLLLDAKMVDSKSDAKRVIEQGGVTINDVRYDHAKSKFEAKQDMIIKVGKHKYLKLKI